MKPISNVMPTKANYVITYNIGYLGCNIIKEITISECETLNDVNNKLFKLIKEEKIPRNATILKVKRLMGTEIFR